MNCRTTAYKRKKRNVPIADPHPDLDRLQGERSDLVLQISELAQSSAGMGLRLAAANRERRRLAYAVEAALERSEDRIGDHAEAIRRVAAEAAETTDQLEVTLQKLATSEAALKAVTAERDRLATVLAGRVADGRPAATAPTAGHGRPASAAPATGPAVIRPTPTVATQIYRTLAALTSDLRARKGELLEEADYELIRHVGKYRDRLSANTTDCDWRTIYYFNKITTAEFGYAKRQGTRPPNVVHAVELRNALIPLLSTGFPDRLPRDGQTVTMPATLTQEPTP